MRRRCGRAQTAVMSRPQRRQADSALAPGRPPKPLPSAKKRKVNSGGPQRPALLSLDDDLAALDYHRDVEQVRDVGERIAGQADDVRELAGFERAAVGLHDGDGRVTRQDRDDGLRRAGQRPRPQLEGRRLLPQPAGVGGVGRALTGPLPALGSVSHGNGSRSRKSAVFAASKYGTKTPSVDIIGMPDFAIVCAWAIVS